MTAFELELDDICLMPLPGAPLLTLGRDGPEIPFSALDMLHAMREYLIAHAAVSEDCWSAETALNDIICQHALQRAREQYRGMSAHERLRVVESVMRWRDQRAALDELIGMGLDDDDA